jgi:hypothetical protein
MRYDQYKNIAAHYAPVIYQEVEVKGKCNHADNGRADYITNVDFDGDWNALNNWENEPSYPLKANVYYSVVESTNRYYITYGFFHPRDYKNNFEFETEHENDFEGIWLSVYKNGNEYGDLEVMATVFHNRFLHYSDYDVGYRQKIDGKPAIFNGKIYIYIESRGHGIKGNANSSYIFPEGKGVVYRYAGVAVEPVSPVSHLSITVACGYDLINMDELWNRRPGGIPYINEESSKQKFLSDKSALSSKVQFTNKTMKKTGSILFHSKINFAGDGKASCGCLLIKNSPHAPWGWDNLFDNIKSGIQFSDPASYFSKALSFERIKGHIIPSEEKYINNPYENP